MHVSSPLYLHLIHMNFVIFTMIYVRYFLDELLIDSIQIFVSLIDLCVRALTWTVLCQIFLRWAVSFCLLSFFIHIFSHKLLFWSSCIYLFPNKAFLSLTNQFLMPNFLIMFGNFWNKVIFIFHSLESDQIHGCLMNLCCLVSSCIQWQTLDVFKKKMASQPIWHFHSVLVCSTYTISDFYLRWKCYPI